MIDGVKQFPLKRFDDERGAVLHMLRNDHEAFQKFGEVYFSKVNRGFVKGWKLHKEVFQNMTVPVGAIEIVIYDPRKESPTFNKYHKYTLSENSHSLLHMPPGLWYAFRSVNCNFALIANCISAPHSPDESVTSDFNNPNFTFDFDHGILTCDS